LGFLTPPGSCLHDNWYRNTAPGTFFGHPFLFLFFHENAGGLVFDLGTLMR
jgi:hypothetical protein